MPAQVAYTYVNEADMLNVGLRREKFIKIDI